MYPGSCRPARIVAGAARLRQQPAEAAVTGSEPYADPRGANWRFRIADGEEVCFTDLHLGPQRFVAGRDFGDFIVWRRDDVPAYQLAVVVDDAAMGITESARGADLLKSTARQILLFRALGLWAADFYHCDLVRNSNGVRLAKSARRLEHTEVAAVGMEPGASAEWGDIPDVSLVVGARILPMARAPRSFAPQDRVL